MPRLLVLCFCVNGACDVGLFAPGPACPGCGERGAMITVSMPPKH